MPRYVAFFSSINVAGNRLKMADLRSALEKEDFAKVETVVASGNVLFDHEDRPVAGIEEKLGAVMQERFGMDSFAAVRSRDEVAGAIVDNPFAGQGGDTFVHTMFLDGPLERAKFDALLDYYKGPEKLAPGGRELYIDFREGLAGSKLTSAFLARRLGRRGTARNMRSLVRIVAKMDEA